MLEMVHFVSVLKIIFLLLCHFIICFFFYIGVTLRPPYNPCALPLQLLVIVNLMFYGIFHCAVNSPMPLLRYEIHIV